MLHWRVVLREPQGAPHGWGLMRDKDAAPGAAGRCPGKQIRPPAGKQGLQVSNNRRHAGDLQDCCGAVGNGMGPMTGQQEVVTWG